MLAGNVAIIVLAAGASKRLGQPKQFLVYRGEPLVRRTVRIACEAALGPVIVVTSSIDRNPQSSLGDPPCQLVENSDASAGIGSSIKAGMACIDRNTAAVAITLCDQLALSSEQLQQLAGRLSPTINAVASEYSGTFGVPAVFDRTLFGELRSIPDSCGAKSLLASLGTRLATVPFPGGELDIDSPEDLSRLL